MVDSRTFRDRHDAGRQLARLLATRRSEPDALVFGLPRGGVPVAFEIAQTVGAELDVFLVRKLGVPGQEELALGAIASGGVRVLNDSVLRELQLAPEVIQRIAEREERELRRREELYRAGREPRPIVGRVIILVDDGLATGASMKAAATAVRLQGPKRVVAAVPVGAKDTCDELRMHVDEMICMLMPHPFVSLSNWYEDFSQTTDEEVRELLDKAAG